jgi:hypothetical protein
MNMLGSERDPVFGQCAANMSRLRRWEFAFNLRWHGVRKGARPAGFPDFWLCSS